MHSSRLSVVAAALIGAWLLVNIPSTAQVQAPASRVAIANPGKIFSQLLKTRDIQTQMQARLNALEQQRQGKATEIRDLESQRDLLVVNSPARAAMQNDIFEKSAALQAWMAARKREIELEQKAKTLATFDEVVGTIAKVAELRGIEIVLSEQKPQIPEDMEQVSVQQLHLMLMQRNVLYARALSDISDAVVTQMDAEYKAGAK